jgi:hypothetical protein
MVIKSIFNLKEQIKNMKTQYYLFLTLLVALLASCAEEPRYDINADDKVPPAAPVFRFYEAYPGGVTIFYTPPRDEDVISIDAEYTRASDGRVFHYAASYLTDNISVNGLVYDDVEYDIELYARDRAGNKSPVFHVNVTPEKSALVRVKETLVVKGGFDALFATWQNELKEAVNVLVEYTFTLNGKTETLTKVFTSPDSIARFYISDLTVETPVTAKAWVTDIYGNESEKIDFGSLTVLKDRVIPKFDVDKNPLWKLPDEKTVPFAEYGDNVAQCFGSWYDGLLKNVIDGRIDGQDDVTVNYLFCPTGDDKNGNTIVGTRGKPWDLIIDLGDYYELSRVLTHQRNTRDGGDSDKYGRGNYYRNGNVGTYRMYRWDEELKQWDTISLHRIPMPSVPNSSELEWHRLGVAGDLAYMYPNLDGPNTDSPAYTKPTRWFRYQALTGFRNNYKNEDFGCLSEITLYAK